MSDLCATLHIPVFWESEGRVVPGKTTARAWRQSVTGLSQALAVVGGGLHTMATAWPWHARDAQAPTTMQTRAPGYEGMGQGCRETAWAQEQAPREFR